MNRGLLPNYRKMRGITQDEMADLIGVARISYHYMEIGKMKIKTKYALRIMKALNIDTSAYPDLSDVNEVDFVSVKALLDKCGIKIDLEGLF